MVYGWLVSNTPKGYYLFTTLFMDPRKTNARRVSIPRRVTTCLLQVMVLDTSKPLSQYRYPEGYYLFTTRKGEKWHHFVLLVSIPRRGTTCLLLEKCLRNTNVRINTPKGYYLFTTEIVIWPDFNMMISINTPKGYYLFTTCSILPRLFRGAVPVSISKVTTCLLLQGYGDYSTF